MKTKKIEIKASTPWRKDLSKDWGLFDVTPNEFMFFSDKEREKYEKFIKFGKKYKITVEEVSWKLKNY